MKRNLLTAALIVKNEERYLDLCLSSLKEIADEVVIVDTGSTDKSREIAASYGARVSQVAWTGDFSAARNHALDQATGEWILYIDADERVRPGSAAGLRAELTAHSVIGYRVLLHPRPGHSAYWSLRLFKNDPTIRFQGMIHESTWPTLLEYRARHGGIVGFSSAILDHEGYESNQDAKHDRNLPLLLKSLEQEPDRVYSWCHLANIYMALNDRPKAQGAWENALQVVRTRGVQAPEDLLPYLGLIELSLTLGRDANQLLQEATAIFPFSVRLEWLRGRVLMREGNFTSAIEAFEGLIARGASGNYDRWAAHDLRLFGAFAFDAIATCYFRLAEYSRSAQYYSLAVENEPEDLQYRVKRDLSSRLASRSVITVACGAA